MSARIRALCLGNGGAALLPACNCWTEIVSFLSSKIEPVFYNINKNLVVDLDDLVGRITRKIKTILVTHFLGFPHRINEIRKICDGKKLFLIEDCAHALFSSCNTEYLGSAGDIAIFSLLKTIPVPNGEVLLIGNRNLRFKTEFRKASSFATYCYAEEVLRFRSGDGKSTTESSREVSYRGVYKALSLVRLFLAGLRKLLGGDGLYLVYPDSYLFNDDLIVWGMSKLSKKIMNVVAFEDVKEIRRRNFGYLLNHFIEITVNC